MEVLVAMSGGVDSSVAAAELIEAGHEVVGVTMKLWGGPSDTGCCSVADTDDARRVADALGIDHHVFNFGDDFDRLVVEPYVDAHRSGRTPNPCIECNRHLKFDRLVDRAIALGFDAVATGHHARIVETGGIRRVARGEDRAKDQSYVLYMLDQDRLGQLLLPIGHLDKREVRRRAEALGLRTAAKPDSQDVCFITSDDGRQRFLASRMELTPGTVVDGDGAAVGAIPAVQLVTIGQRKGLGLKGGTAPRFVTSVDVDAATVVVGDSGSLMVDRLSVHDVVWAVRPITGPVDVQVSAHGEVAPAELVGDTVRWLAPHRRVAPGQSVVFYDGDRVLGGGIAG